MEDRKDVVPRGVYSPAPFPENLDRTHVGEVHVHHHYAAPVIDNRPVEQNPGQEVLERYAPYFILLLGGLVILAIVAVVLVLLAPVLMTMMVTVMVVAVCLVVLVIAVAGSVKALRETPKPVKGRRGRR